MGLIGAMSAASLVLAACGSGSIVKEDGSVELVVATMAEIGTVGSAVQDWFADELEARSDGMLTLEITAPNSLCPANEIAVCAQDGRVDIGVTIPDYTPQLFPQITVVSVPFLASDQQALMQALYEVNHEHAGAIELWERNHLQMLAHWSAGRLLLGSETPVDSISDISGQRWRVSGPYLQRAIEAAGGSNVALSAPETYEGIQRGVADSAAFALDGMVAYQLIDLLPHFTDAATGHYNTFGMWINTDSYEAIPEDLREIFDEVVVELNSGAGTAAFRVVADGQCDDMWDHDNVQSLNLWSDEATQEWVDLVGDELTEMWVKDATRNGLSDAQGYLDRYTELVAQYEVQDSTDPTLECIDRFASAAQGD